MTFSSSRPADAYHTLYCTAGLSAAQHRVIPSEAREKAVISAWHSSQAHAKAGMFSLSCCAVRTPLCALTGPSAEESRHPGTVYAPSSDADREMLDELRKGIFAHAMSWSEEDGTAVYVGGAANRVVSFSDPHAGDGPKVAHGSLPDRWVERYPPAVQSNRNPLGRDAVLLLRPDSPVTVCEQTGN